MEIRSVPPVVYTDHPTMSFQGLHMLIGTLGVSVDSHLDPSYQCYSKTPVRSK